MNELSQPSSPLGVVNETSAETIIFNGNRPEAEYHSFVGCYTYIRACTLLWTLDQLLLLHMKKGPHFRSRSQSILTSIVCNEANSSRNFQNIFRVLLRKFKIKSEGHLFILKIFLFSGKLHKNQSTNLAQRGKNCRRIRGLCEHFSERTFHMNLPMNKHPKLGGELKL